MKENERTQKNYADEFVMGWVFFSIVAGAAASSSFPSLTFGSPSSLLPLFFLGALFGLILFFVPAALYVFFIVFLLDISPFSRSMKTNLLSLSGVLFLTPVVMFFGGNDGFSPFEGQSFALFCSYAGPMLCWIYIKDPYRAMKEASDSSDEFDENLDSF